MWESPEDIREAEGDMSNPGLTCSVPEAVKGTARRQAEMQESYRDAQCISQSLTDFSTLGSVGEYRLKWCRSLWNHKWDRFDPWLWSVKLDVAWPAPTVLPALPRSALCSLLTPSRPSNHTSSLHLEPLPTLPSAAWALSPGTQFPDFSFNLTLEFLWLLHSAGPLCEFISKNIILTDSLINTECRSFSGHILATRCVQVCLHPCWSDRWWACLFKVGMREDVKVLSEDQG